MQATIQTPLLDNFVFSYLLMPNVQKNNLLNSNLTIDYTLFKGSALSGSFSFQNLHNTNDIFRPTAAFDPRLFSYSSAFFW